MVHICDSKLYSMTTRKYSTLKYTYAQYHLNNVDDNCFDSYMRLSMIMNIERIIRNYHKICAIDRYSWDEKTAAFFRNCWRIWKTILYHSILPGVRFKWKNMSLLFCSWLLHVYETACTLGQEGERVRVRLTRVMLSIRPQIFWLLFWNVSFGRIIVGLELNDTYKVKGRNWKIRKKRS